MIYKAKTVLVLNESSKVRLFEDPDKIREQITEAQDQQGDNYTWVTQIYFFGFFSRCVCINVKRILYFYGTQKDQ